MNNWWPWVVMGLGVISLFLYRYALFLKSNTREVDNEAVAERTMTSGNAGAAPAAPAPATSTQPAPQRQASPAAKVEIDSDDLKISKPAPQGAPGQTASHYASEHVWMPIVISLIVLLSALFVILSNNTYGDAQQKWAFGVVGTIIGYWFKK